MIIRDHTPPTPANNNRPLKLQPEYALPTDPERLLACWRIGIAIAAAEAEALKPPGTPPVEEESLTGTLTAEEWEIFRPLFFRGC